MGSARLAFPSSVRLEFFEIEDDSCAEVRFYRFPKSSENRPKIVFPTNSNSVLLSAAGLAKIITPFPAQVKSNVTEIARAVALQVTAFEGAEGRYPNGPHPNRQSKSNQFLGHVRRPV